MGDAVAITRDGHRVLLKWHRARRRAADAPFTGRRVVEGLKLGACVEVDLVVHAGAGFAVLHDLALDAATTGVGPVREADPRTLRGLRLRGEDGAPLPERVMLLEDLADLLARERVHPEGLLQLDFKEGQTLDAATVAAFGRIVAPLARHVILSSGDAEAVRRLSAGVEGLRIGHDPCGADATARLRASGDVAGFAEEAVAASSRAGMIYLDHRLVLWAEAAGLDLVAAFRARGRRVDAYTVPRADADGIGTARRLLALRVDQITTDDPEGLGASLG